MEIYAPSQILDPLGRRRSFGFGTGVGGGGTVEIFTITLLDDTAFNRRGT